MYEVIIVGGGIAGLSAALVLGRCRRRVLVCDSNRPRNGAASALHGFLSRDGIDPWELRRIGQEQLNAYPSIEFRREEVETACRTDDSCFEIMTKSGKYRSRMLLLATGIVDRLPEIVGIEAFYGKSVYHCPFCDGWEARDRPLAVYAQGEAGAEFALEIRGWSADLVFCPGSGDISREECRRLKQYGIEIRSERLVEVTGRDGQLEELVFADGSTLPRQGLFFLPEQVSHSPLARSLGCEPTGNGQMRTGTLQKTKIPGLYLAGDAARSVKLAIVAAAEGAEAAFAMQTALLRSEYP